MIIHQYFPNGRSPPRFIVTGAGAKSGGQVDQQVREIELRVHIVAAASAFQAG
jgi:hypothetical protein